ncbi:Negative regulator of mitotic exit [Mortierella alpina]|nr:Negative regulator of mitotic exit [Mortierella alpina]
MGILNKKKKDKDAFSGQQGNSNTPKQRPPPSPNGLHGANNGSGGAQRNGPSSPLFATGSSGPMSPMSPTSPYPGGGNGSPGMVSRFPSGPPSPVQAHFSNIGASPPASSSAALLATPQLFWSQRRVLGINPFPRFQHTSSITTNGTDIFLYGGSQRGTTKGDLFVIDSVSLQCQAISATGAEQPMAKSGHSAVNIGQYVIYFGGWDSMTGQCDNNLHVLHTARREWNKPPIQGPLPTPRHSHIGCNVGTTMYIFGGQVDDHYMDDINAFDMKTITQSPKWEKLEPQTESPPARSGHCAGVYEGRIYIFGGADAEYFYNDIWCFDPRALTWTPIPASGYLPTGRHGHACTVVDGTMYIFGGNSPDGTELNDAYAFKIHERRWYLFQNVGPVASPRSGHTMCTVKDRIYVLGGESEQTKQEDSAQIYYLEIPKIRFPDAGPQAIPPRQTSTQKLVPNRLGAGSPQPYQQSLMDPPAPVNREADRNSGPVQTPGRPERPDRPDRRLTQRPASPASFGSNPNLTISQQTSQLMNPQLGQRPITAYGALQPRGSSVNAGLSKSDYQAEGLSIATRRQTLKDDFHGGYGGAVIGTAREVASPNMNRRTAQPASLNTTSANGNNPSPLRVINVTPSSPPLSARQIPDSPTTARAHDRRADASLPSHSNQQTKEDINPYAMEAITPITPTTPTTSNSGQTALGAYTPPPPPPPGSRAAPMTPPPSSSPGPLPPPPTSAVGASAAPPTLQQPSHPPLTPPPPPPPPPSVLRGNLPPPPVAPSPPVSGSIAHPPGADKKAPQIHPPPPPPTPPVGSSTPIPGPLDRSTSPASASSRSSGRGSGGHNGIGLGIGATSIPTSGQGAGISARTSLSDITKIKALESRAEVVQDENVQLRQELKEKSEQLEQMKKRENWLMTEIVLSRDRGAASPTPKEKRLSMAELERDLNSTQLEGQQLRITRALIKVKEELKTAKMAIVTQAQTATAKIKEAERIRTGALQEAAYLKAKLSALSSSQQDPDALSRIEGDRAANLERRLTNALNELESLDSQYTKAQEHLEQERRSRMSAEERSNDATLLAEQAQAAHTRALTELATLHTRAAKAETEARESAAALAEIQAGMSGHQSQSSGLLVKINSLKQQVEQHEKALERTQMAYAAANERAVRAEARSEKTSEKIEKLEGLRLNLSSEVNRYQGEAERSQSKIEELESRLQVSKEEVVTLRKLVEDGLGAFNPRGNSNGRVGALATERKHDSIAILNTVSRVSELEHELGSLKKLHTSSQEAASQSAAELAEAMLELSRLEQVSMQARTETISLQKMLSQEREGASRLQTELTKAEQELEVKIKSLEDYEVQLGLLQDVMRENGIIAEDLILQARARGAPEYAATMEERVRDAENKVQDLEKEMKDSRSRHLEQLEAFEMQRQATVQHSEKTAMLLRKIKGDLATTIKAKDEVESELRQLQEEHSRCDNLALELTQSRSSNQKEQEERIQKLQMHWEEERNELTTKADGLQQRLKESEMLATELSHKVISITQRLEEVESANEVLSEELESIQTQAEQARSKSAEQESQLKADVERLVTEIHQVQERLVSRQQEVDDAFELNKQLEDQLERALQQHADAITASVSTQQHAEDRRNMEQQHQVQRQDLELRLKKAHETIQILEGDNSVLEARLADTEKKVTLLLENMQTSRPSSISVPGLSNSLSNHSSPFNSANLASAVRQKLNGNNANASPPSSFSYPGPQGPLPPVSDSGHGLINDARKAGNAGSKSGSPSSPSAQHSKSISQLLSYDSDSTDDENGYDRNQYGSEQQPQQGSLYDNDDPESSNRDSVDSITRELELLKVPWNKTAFTSSPHSLPQVPTTSPPQHYQQQQQQQQEYHYAGQASGHHPPTGAKQFYDYTDDEDSSDGDNEEEHLSHLRQQQQQQQQQRSMDTHTYNDRSPSRLREYEQMIDEIENSRMR